MNVLCVQTDTNSFGPDGTRPAVGQNNKNLMDLFFFFFQTMHISEVCSH